MVFPSLLIHLNGAESGAASVGGEMAVKVFGGGGVVGSVLIAGGASEAVGVDGGISGTGG